VASVDPARLLAAAPDDFFPAGPLRLLVLGKAGAALAAAAHRRLGDRVAEALVVRPPGPAPDHPYPEIKADHPVPTARSVAAGEAALALARASAADRQPLLVLLSGGASALLEAPAPGLSLDDLRDTTSALLASGAPIAALNTVRKHLSAVKGGRLAAAAGPARVHTLALSDVVGDDPATIGSGPTAPDPTTFADALAVLDGLDVPDAVRAHLRSGVRGDLPETPDALPHAVYHLLGSNADALRGAAARARALGLPVRVVTRTLAGEAREVGRDLAAALCEATPGVLLWAGETTVTLRGTGRGGRNQELALAAALALDGAGSRPLGLLAAGTDGVDGPTAAAGAVVGPQTATRFRAAGLDPEAALADNDSHGLFSRASEAGALGAGEGLVEPGPTGTNVMDLVVGVVTDDA
jgi:hydroxypyruvate reductase